MLVSYTKEIIPTLCYKEIITLAVEMVNSMFFYASTSWKYDFLMGLDSCCTTVKVNFIKLAFSYLIDKAWSGLSQSWFLQNVNYSGT